MNKVVKRIIIGSGLTVLVVLLSFGRIINMITDFLWFDSLQYESVFWTELITKISLAVPIWIFLGLVLSFFLQMLYKEYKNNQSGDVILVSSKKVTRLIWLFSFLIGAFVSIAISKMIWFDYLKVTHAVQFPSTDPIFGLNVGFYMYTLPFIKEILQICLVMVFFLGVIAISFELFYENTAKTITSEYEHREILSRVNYSQVATILKKRRILLTVFFILLGGLFFLHTYELVYSTRGVAFGASYTDVHVTLLAYRIYALISLGFAGMIFFISGRKNTRYLLIGPTLLALTAVLFTMTGFFVQKLIVEPDEISKEREYLQYNIDFTQKAYNIDSIELVEFPYVENLNQAAIERNSETIKNIRINDARPLQQTYNQIQSIRLYYDFYDIDTDRYVINDQYTQVLISARELNQYKLDNKAMTWLNQYLKYTHGYGVVMSPVNQVTPEGQPLLYFKNIPPITATNLRIERPELYFGEETEKYIIVNTDEKEFDYPSGSDNVEATYFGEPGIKLSGFRKLLFAIKENSAKMLVSNNIDADSKIIINRNISERVKEIAPFLTYDNDPYIVLNEEDGKLYWIIDGYSTSSHYPYSQTMDLNGATINYIRNSVKVVIDAYDGTTHYYVFDDNDPLIQTYSAIYPELFRDRSQFPTGIISHIRYPQNYFDIQADIYKRYHVTNPVVFYNGEDVWDIATEKYMSAVQTVESNYVMFKIDEQAEFALILPFTPKGKPNMTSLLVARNDGDQYGKVFVYRFPKDKTIQGPIMIESRIDQDSVISPQFTLWGQQGSTVLRGNVIVVPIENSLLYVEPVYIQSDNENSLPEMKRVIVAYGDKIYMEQTLQQGLDKLFGAAVKEDPLESTLRELLDEINKKAVDTQTTLTELELLIQELEKKIEEMTP